MLFRRFVIRHFKSKSMKLSLSQVKMTHEFGVLRCGSRVLFTNEEIREGHRRTEVGDADGAFGWAFECGFNHLRIDVLGFGEGGGGLFTVEFEAEVIPLAEFELVGAEDDRGFAAASGALCQDAAA